MPVMSRALAGVAAAFRPGRRAEALTAALLVLPAFVGFLLFHAWPTWRALQISFTDWNLLSEPRFVGLGNYATLLQDGNF
jgi:multiple sugar transport system permease protein